MNDGVDREPAVDNPRWLTAPGVGRIYLY